MYSWSTNMTLSKFLTKCLVVGAITVSLLICGSAIANGESGCHKSGCGTTKVPSPPKQ